MKVEVKECKNEKKEEFPKLMWFNNRSSVLLATSKIGNHYSGMIVGGESVGAHDNEWCLGPFEPFNGTLTLSND